MNTEEMNLALAKWMGIVECDLWGHLWGDYMTKGACRHESCVPKGRLPDYCNDLNAIRTVEEKLTEETQMEYYEYHLRVVVAKAFYLDAKDADCVGNFHLIHATAAQKAEALVRALGLTKEGL